MQTGLLNYWIIKFLDNLPESPFAKVDSGRFTGDIRMTFLSAMVLFGLIIFIHELGHFLFAKLLGVRVLKFSLGFGPKLIGRKYGDTEYLISSIPFGGYVKMFGEESGEEQRG